MSETSLAQVIELLLFTVYPCTCTALLSWAVTVIFSIHLAPYAIIIIGFILLQLFLVPSPSSFKVSIFHGKEDEYLLEPPMVGLLVVIYCFFPPFTFMLKTLYLSPKSFIQIETLFQFIFIISSVAFLASYLNIRLFLDHSGIPVKYVYRLRWITAQLSLVMASFLMKLLPVSTGVLSWLPLAVYAHAGLGISLGTRSWRKFSFILALVTNGFYIFILTKCPWALSYTFTIFNFSLRGIYIFFAIVNFIGSVTMILSANGTKELFGFVTLLYSLGFIFCEYVLHQDNMYSLPLLVASTAIVIYSAIRLHHVRKLSTVYTLLLVSFHVTKVTTTLLPEILLSTVLAQIYICASSMVLYVLLIKFLVFDDFQSLTTHQICTHVIAIGLALIAVSPTLLFTLLKFILQDRPTIIDLIVFGMLVWGVLCLKISLSQKVSDQVVRHIAPGLLCSAVLLAIVQPSTDLSVISVVNWFLMVTFVSILAIFARIWLCKTNISMIVFAVLCGGPLAAKLVTLIYMIPPIYVFILSIICGIALAYMGISLIKCSFNDAEKRVINMASIIFICSVCLLVPEFLAIKHFCMIATFLAWRLLATFFTIAALMIKIYSMSDKALDLVNKDGYKDSYLPFIGNVFTFQAYVALCLLLPIIAWDVWMSLCSIIFFLFMKDSCIFTRLTRHNQVTPTIIVSLLILFVSTLARNHIWYTVSSMFYMQGMFEIILIIATLPVYITLYTVLWLNKNVLPDRLVPFLLPCNFFLLYGCSYQSWILGFVGIITCIWLMTYKLRFERPPTQQNAVENLEPDGLNAR